MTVDSSLHSTPHDSRDYAIRTGVVRNYLYDERKDVMYYTVDVFQGSRQFSIACQQLVKFGGPFNYEEFSRSTWTLNDNAAIGGEVFLRPGDIVVVALLNGRVQTADPTGVIIGSLKHAARKSILKDKNVAYQSEFNGIETSINKDGEFKQTFKGLPTNNDILSKAPEGQRIPDPLYNLEVGSSYYQWDKTGSWKLTDNTKELPQSVFIDKPNGKIIITSGATILTINKAEESYVIVNKKTTFNSTDEWNLNTKKTTIKSTDLFDLEAKDIKTKGKWQQDGNMVIKGDIDHTGNYKQMGNSTITGNVTATGNLTATGICSLGDGTYPLVYDIAMIIGVGNMGFPVVSNAILLKTVKTKAS
jgi:hypothetical protein